MMFQTMLAALSILFLLISPVQADTPTGSFAVKVPSKYPFVATVTLSKGAVTGFTMERNEIAARSATVSTKGIDINVEFLGGCGAGSKGQLNLLRLKSKGSVF